MLREARVQPVLLDTYLAVVKNSTGSNAFRNFYAKVRGRKRDIARDGELSCAFFVSSVLLTFGLIKRLHGTVSGVERDLKRSGWKRIARPRTGSIFVWEELEDDRGEGHKHIGFYLGGTKSVSNSSRLGQPAEHHFKFMTKNGCCRKISAIHWHPRLARG